MELFVLRHGDAEPQATTDDARPLSMRGNSEVETVMQAAAGDMQAVELILVSPLLRAQQTADIASQFLALDMQRHTTALLTPDSNPDSLYRLLQQRSEQSILLVSHQPLVGAVVNQLCGKGFGYHAMGTANLACIDGDIVAPSCGNLRWLKRPAD